MRRNWQRLAGLAVAGAVLVGAPALVAGDAHSGRDAATLAATEAWQALIGGTRWVVGSRQHYVVEAELGVLASTTPVTVTLKSKLTAHTLATRGGRVEVWMKLDEPRLSVNGAATSATGARDLEQPFLSVYDASGRLVEYQFSPRTTRQTRNFLRVLIAETQLVAPPSLGGQQAWSAREQDGMGEYLASYELEPNSGRLGKRKSRYVRAAPGATNARGLVEVLDSNKDFELDSAGGIARIAAKERTKARIAEAGGFEMTLELELVRTRVERDAPAPHTSEPWVRAGTANDVEDAAAALAFADRRLVDGANLGELIGALANAADDEARDKAQRRLEALFRSVPAAVGELDKRALEKGNTASTGHILHALAGSGTREAQAALSNWITDRHASGELRTAALQALAFTPRPRPESVRAVASVLDDAALRESAALTLGTLAHSTAQTDAPSSSFARAELVRRYDGAASVEQRTPYLDALGNVGSSEALGSIEGALQSNAEVERVHALRALRLIESPRARTLLEKAMTTDRSSAVRAEAVFAATFVHHRALVPALGRVARSDASNSVRSAAIHTLGKLAKTSSEAEQILRHCSASDSSPKLKALAAQYLFGRRR